MKNCRRDYNEARPHSAIGNTPDIADERFERHTATPARLPSEKPQRAVQNRGAARPTAQVYFTLERSCEQRHSTVHLVASLESGRILADRAN